VGEKCRKNLLRIIISKADFPGSAEEVVMARKKDEKTVNKFVTKHTTLTINSSSSSPTVPFE
jgi:hypothetical protein